MVFLGGMVLNSKTTLLRMISERQLVIPLYISVLHVEQETGVVVEQVQTTYF